MWAIYVGAFNLTFAAGIGLGLTLFHQGYPGEGRGLVLFLVGAHVALGLVLVAVERRLWRSAIGKAGIPALVLGLQFLREAFEPGAAQVGQRGGGAAGQQQEHRADRPLDQRPSPHGELGVGCPDLEPSSYPDIGNRNPSLWARRAATTAGSIGIGCDRPRGTAMSWLCTRTSSSGSTTEVPNGRRREPSWRSNSATNSATGRRAARRASSATTALYRPRCRAMRRDLQRGDRGAAHDMGRNVANRPPLAQRRDRPLDVGEVAKQPASARRCSWVCRHTSSTCTVSSHGSLD